jgi:capsular polysaccharide biosynthesis protein
MPKTSDREFITKAFSLLVGGANSFQHFIQDCLPILFFLKKEELINKDFTVLLYEPLDKHKIIHQILDRYFPDLSIFWVKFGSVLLIESLQVLRFKPRNFLFSLPQKIVSSVPSKFTILEGTESVDRRTIYLTYLDRGNNATRNITNSESFESTLKEIARDLGLRFIKFVAESKTLDEIISILDNSAIVIGIHGGSMYNSIWAGEKAVIFEIVPIKNTDSLANLLTDLKLPYCPIPLNFDKYDNEVFLSNNELQAISNLIKQVFKSRRSLNNSKP